MDYKENIMKSLKELQTELKQLDKQKRSIQRVLAWKIECRMKVNKLKRDKWATPKQIDSANRALIKAETKVTELKGYEKRRKEIVKEIKKIERKLNPTPKKTKVAKEIKEVETKLKEVEKLEAEVELELRELEAIKEKIRIKREKDALNIKLAEEEVAAIEKENELLIKKIEASKIREALTEKYNKLLAKKRLEDNIHRIFTEKQRREVFLRDGGQCQSCGKEVSLREYEVDHIIPWSKGGTTTIENGQCLCRACNRKKGAL